jgi:predicted small lipoprotein YifL
MGSHALAPPLTLHAPSRTTIWVVLAIAALLALAAAGLALALELPAGQPTAPAQFQGNS